MRLAIVTSHPIQYQAPWFRGLAAELDLHVYFAHRQTPDEQAKAGYGVAFDWDVELLDGYRHTFLRNRSKHPNVYEFAGCDTPDVADILRAERYDAVIVNGWYLKSYLQTLLACKRLRIPIMVRGDSQLASPRQAWKRIAKQLAYRPLLSAFDACLCVGLRNREYLRHYGVAEQRIFDVPHFVDTNHFASKAQAARSRRESIRGALGLQPTDLVALFVGRMLPFKRPLDIVHAVALLREQRVRPLFVGTGPLEASLRSASRAEGVDAVFAGFRNQSELPDFYVASDVLVLPSDGRETWGLVVNEAMTCGLPAIVSDAVGCGPDLIEDGKTGRRYPLGDITQLANAIAAQRIIDGAIPVRAAIQAKIERYSCERAVAGTIQALRYVAGGG